MTKLLILSDSHGSADAVRRILTAEKDADAVLFLGDGLHDLEKALTAATLICERTYSIEIVKSVVRMTVEKLCGNSAVNAAEMKTFLQNVNRKYSPQLINDKAAWEPIIAQVRTVLETY